MPHLFDFQTALTRISGEPMPSGTRRTCLVCGNHDSVVGPISWRGNCSECGSARLEQAVLELHARKGPMYRRWQARLHEATRPERLDAVRIDA